MLADNIIEIIKKHSEDFNLNPIIVHSIIIAESNGDVAACRYESGYRWLYKPESVKPKLSSIETEHVFQKISWGLGQVMGAVLREYGYSNWLPAIVSDIYAQVYYMCKHLSVLKKRFPEGNDYIAAYNAGSPRKLSSGKYTNQKYIDKVIALSKDVNI